MTRKLFNWSILLALTIGVTSCSKQVQEDATNGSVSKPEIITTGLSKIIAQSPNSGDNIHASIQDKDGNFWFASTSDGIFKYDGKSFTQFTVEHGLHSNNVYSIFEDKEDKIWIGTSAGINYYNGESFSKIQKDLSNEINLDPTALKNNNRSDRYNVFSIMQDKSGKIWFATVNGVYVYDGTSFTPFIFNEGAGGFLNKEKNNAEYVLEDGAGNIWFGGRGNDGVFRYDGTSITNFKIQEEKGSWVWPVLQDKNGDIWFSNWEGAYRYDGTSFISVTKSDGLCSDVVTRIMEDQNGNLWFGGNGLSRYDGNSFTCFTTKDELPSNGVWSILEDKTGNLWLGTKDNGLSRFDGVTFTSFSEEKQAFSVSW